MAFATPKGEAPLPWNGVHFDGPKATHLDSISAVAAADNDTAVEYSHTTVDGKVEVFTERLKMKAKAKKTAALPDYEKEQERLWQVIRDYEDKNGVLGEDIRDALADAHNLQSQNEQLADKKLRRTRKPQVQPRHIVTSNPRNTSAHPAVAPQISRLVRKLSFLSQKCWLVLDGGKYRYDTPKEWVLELDSVKMDKKQVAARSSPVTRHPKPHIS